MEKEVYDLILNEILAVDNFKIDQKEKLEDYLKNFKNQNLVMFCLNQIWVDEDFEDLYKVHNLRHKSKQYIIDYIVTKLNVIVASYFKIMDESLLNQFQVLVKQKGYMKIAISDLKFSIAFLNFLKSFCFGKVHYDKKGKTIEIFIPEELVKCIKKSISSKEIMTYNEKCNQIYSYTEGVLNAYGIINLIYFHELFEKQMFKIDIHELNKILNAKSMLSENINIFTYNDDMLICNIEFADEDFAISFYEDTKGQYHKFSKEDFALLARNQYHISFNSYKKFISYLKSEYELEEEDVIFINDFIIFDFLVTAQMSLEESKENLKSQLLKNFENIDVEKCYKLLKEIFKEYPKWHKKGNK